MKTRDGESVKAPTLEVDMTGPGAGEEDRDGMVITGRGRRSEKLARIFEVNGSCGVERGSASELESNRERRQTLASEYYTQEKPPAQGQMTRSRDEGRARGVAWRVERTRVQVSA